MRQRPLRDSAGIALAGLSFSFALIYTGGNLNLVAKIDFGALLGMPQSAVRYRNEAKECRVMAEKLVSQPDKDAWLCLAANWTRLAESTEWRNSMRPESRQGAR